MPIRDIHSTLTVFSSVLPHTNVLQGILNKLLLLLLLLLLNKCFGWLIKNNPQSIPCACFIVRFFHELWETLCSYINKIFSLPAPLFIVSLIASFCYTNPQYFSSIFLHAFLVDSPFDLSVCFCIPNGTTTEPDYYGRPDAQ